jgi:hypothetical protein
MQCTGLLGSTSRRAQGLNDNSFHPQILFLKD